MSGWYDRINGAPSAQPVYSTPMVQPQARMNPIQMMNLMSQAMRNPAAFTKEQFPDVPEDILNDPDKILQYIQRTRNISAAQMNQIRNSFPRW